MSLTHRLIYAALFQIGWLVCVCLGDLVALLFAQAIVIFHVCYVRALQPKHRLGREIYWVLLVGTLGFAMETLFFCAGFLYQTNPPELFSRLVLPPLWLFSLWLCFAVALRTCLSFIFHTPLLGYCLVALAIPGSYLAGTYLNNSVQINEPDWLSLLLITLSWILFLMLLKQIKLRYFEDIFYDC